MVCRALPCSGGRPAVARLGADVERGRRACSQGPGDSPAPTCGHRASRAGTPASMRGGVTDDAPLLLSPSVPTPPNQCSDCHLNCPHLVPTWAPSTPLHFLPSTSHYPAPNPAPPPGPHPELPQPRSSELRVAAQGCRVCAFGQEWRAEQGWKPGCSLKEGHPQEDTPQGGHPSKRYPPGGHTPKRAHPQGGCFPQGGGVPPRRAS